MFSTWSEEDEEILNLIIKRLQSHADVDLEEYSKEYDWLNSPKVRSAWKPSDAQMIALNDVITNGHLSNANERILKGLQAQLKKLK
jgi:ATP-dependent 26S proteasome regulatory subunit